MSTYHSTISFGDAPQLLTGRFSRLRRLYGEDAKITYDDRGWLIVDLSSQPFDDSFHAQDNKIVA